MMSLRSSSSGHPTELSETTRSEETGSFYRPTSYSYYNGAYYFGEWDTSRQAYRGSDEGKLGNPLLTWEKAKKMNVGTDMPLLEGQDNTDRRLVRREARQHSLEQGAPCLTSSARTCLHITSEG